MITERRSSLIDPLLTEVELSCQLILRFPGCVIQLKSNNPELIQSLYQYFRPFVAAPSDSPDISILAIESAPQDFPLPFSSKMPDPGKTKIKEEFYDFIDGRVVRKRLTGMIFVFGGNDNIAIGPCFENNNQVVNFINNRFIAWQLERGCLLGHAAAVQQHKRGLALAGISGAGKSTLALHLMSKGASFTSNDRLLVQHTYDAGLAMCGVAKLPRINPGTALNNPDLTNVIPIENIEHFASLSSKELWNLEHKYDVFLDECFGKHRFILEGPMDGLVILNWHHNGQPTRYREVDIEDRHDLLSAFIKSPGLFYLPPEGTSLNPSIEEYAGVLKRTTVLEIYGGVDFGYASQLCQIFLANGSIPTGVNGQ